MTQQAGGSVIRPERREGRRVGRETVLLPLAPAGSVTRQVGGSRTRLGRRVTYPEW